ncbi:MAG: tetratricopeptide repeat protein, partial [Verrucomicrobiales bacterium]
EAIDDCVDLHLPLLRESEMATMLDAFIPVDGRPEYTLLAAKIHAKRTDYEIADGLYRQHLSSHPDDAASWAELGGMWDACSDLEQALEAYRKGSAANPDDDSLHKRIARTLVSLGRFEEALDYYGEMVRYDRKDLTQYLTLATNLGDSVSTNDALRKWFTLPGDRRSIDYLRLARSYGALGQYDQMVTVYERAIDAFPNERGIRIELAGELSRMRRHSDVMRVLASPELREDPEAVSLHLSAAVASKQFKSGLAFSGNNAENRMALPISAKLPLAEIYYQTGSVSKSTRLYSSIPKSELPTLTRATLAFRGGRLAESESLLRRHLASNSKDHRSWSFLASVYQAQRKKPEARDAYQRALDLLKLDMKRR